jgi:hypothetical protein
MEGEHAQSQQDNPTKSRAAATAGTATAAPAGDAATTANAPTTPTPACSVCRSPLAWHELPTTGLFALRFEASATASADAAGWTARLRHHLWDHVATAAAAIAVVPKPKEEEDEDYWTRCTLSRSLLAKDAVLPYRRPNATATATVAALAKSETIGKAAAASSVKEGIAHGRTTIPTPVQTPATLSKGSAEVASTSSTGIATAAAISTSPHERLLQVLSESVRKRVQAIAQPASTEHARVGVLFSGKPALPPPWHLLLCVI